MGWGNTTAITSWLAGIEAVPTVGVRRRLHSDGAGGECPIGAQTDIINDQQIRSERRSVFDNEGRNASSLIGIHTN